MSYLNSHFRFEKLAMAGSDGIAPLNRRFLRFLSVSFTSCLFHKASYADALHIASREVVSVHEFCQIF